MHRFEKARLEKKTLRFLARMTLASKTMTLLETFHQPSTKRNSSSRLPRENILLGFVLRPVQNKRGLGFDLVFG